MFFLMGVCAACAPSLIKLVEKGKPSEALQCIPHTKDLNARNPAGRTALMIAAEKGYLELIQELLSRGADPCLRDSGYARCRFEREPTGGYAFSLAYASQGEWHVLQSKSEHRRPGSGVPFERPAGIAPAPDTSFSVSVSGVSALDLAVEHGHSEVFERLLTEGCEPPGARALVAAAGRGDLKLVRRLLELGVDPNAATSEFFDQSFMGFFMFQSSTTAVAVAAANGHEAVVRYMLERGADPNPSFCSLFYVTDSTAFRRYMELSRQWVSDATWQELEATHAQSVRSPSTPRVRCGDLAEALRMSEKHAMLELLSRGSPP